MSTTQERRTGSAQRGIKPHTGFDCLICRRYLCIWGSRHQGSEKAGRCVHVLSDIKACFDGMFNMDGEKPL